MYPTETQLKIAEWRVKAADGTLTQEEMQAAIKLLREGRVSPAYSADTTKRKRAVAAIPSANDLLDELDGL